MSCTFNQQISELISNLLHAKYDQALHAHIIGEMKEDNIYGKHDPIAIETYLSYKLVLLSVELTTSASLRWMLDKDYEKIQDYFQKIDYDEIAKLEPAEKDRVSELLHSLAHKGDEVAQTYGGDLQKTLVNHLNYCVHTAYDWYNNNIDMKDDLINTCVQTGEEVAKEFGQDLKLDPEDSIFHCHNIDELSEYADYFSLAPSARDVKWLVYQCSWGNDIISKFYNISTTLLLLSKIKTIKGEKLDTSTDLLTEKDIKRISKRIYQKNKEKLNKIVAHDKFRPIEFNHDQLHKGLNSIHFKMEKLLEKIEDARLPIKHEVSADEAKLLDDKETRDNE